MPYTIPQPVLDANMQVFPHQAGGGTVYVKKRRPGRNLFGRLAQRVLHRLTGSPLVLPPRKRAEDSVRFEADMLERLAALGMRVPRVLRVERDYFVMSDAGETLECVLRRDPAANRRRIGQAVRELRRLHDAGFAHGGSQIRNLTVKDGEIYFIDFEEGIPPGQADAFMLRDVFLFMLSLERSGFDPDPAGLCRLYDADDSGRTMSRLRDALMRMRPALILDNRVFRPISMRDIRSLNNLIRKAGRRGAAPPAASEAT